MKKWLVLAVVIMGYGVGSFAAAPSEPVSFKCAASSGLNFLCGLNNPEDLVALPGGKWIVASGMSPKAGLHLINSETKTWERWIAPANRPPRAPYTMCLSQPPADQFQAHGMSILYQRNKTAILYVVNHGGDKPIRDFAIGGDRETIEVFDVDMTGEKPKLTWAGCIPMPGKLVANSVASAPDESVYATVLLHPDRALSDLWNGKLTGAVYKWSPGSTEFKRLAGTELIGNNGIEISRDGKILYVTSFLNVTTFTNTAPAKLLKTVKIPGGIGDNIHWVGDNLVIAGSKIDFDKRNADGVPDIRGYYVAFVNPKTLVLRRIAEGPANSSFNGVSVGLPVGRTLWLGSHASDRIAYRKLP